MIGVIQVHVYTKILHNYENEVTYDIKYNMIWLHTINNILISFFHFANKQAVNQMTKSH